MAICVILAYILMFAFAFGMYEDNKSDKMRCFLFAFEERYVELLSHFPSAKRIICIPFWPNKYKSIHTTNVALKTKSHLVDLSHLDASIVYPSILPS